MNTLQPLKLFYRFISRSFQKQTAYTSAMCEGLSAKYSLLSKCVNIVNILVLNMKIQRNALHV